MISTTGVSSGRDERSFDLEDDCKEKPLVWKAKACDFFACFTSQILMDAEDRFRHSHFETTIVVECLFIENS